MNFRLLNTLVLFAAILAVVYLLAAYEYQRGHDAGLDEGKATCSVSLTA